VAPRFYDLDDNGVPGRWLEMVRHTLKSLGPKVLADRMVGDYVQQLYVPAAGSSRKLNGSFKGAQELAEWKKRVVTGWPEVRVDHVDSSGVGDSPEVGASMLVHAFVSLGELSTDDVEVQILHGRVREGDDLVDVRATPLALGESFEANRHRFDGEVALSSSGPFGYTVRVVPRNVHLASPAELGLVALPTS
jgi:starch phosphorylase